MVNLDFSIFSFLLFFFFLTIPFGPSLIARHENTYILMSRVDWTRNHHLSPSIGRSKEMIL